MGGESIQGEPREPLHPPLVPFRQVSANTNYSYLMCRPGLLRTVSYDPAGHVVPFPRKNPGGHSREVME